MNWSKTFLEWKRGSTAYLSVVFTWDLPAAYQRSVWLKAEGYTVKAGGPAVMLIPNYLADVAECNGAQMPTLKRHNPNATFTSRGCIRRCPFCAVPRIEGNLHELADWEPAPVVCDNNLLACSRAHFDRVVDRLKPLLNIDFNQGLDARLLTDYHAGRLAELDCMVRLAYDSREFERDFMAAFVALRAAGFPKSRIRVYVLIGFQDTPEDALYRLRTVANLGIDPNPMRYQALDSLEKNSYVGEHWTHAELSRYMRYWSNLRYLRSVPFEEWDSLKRKPTPQQALLV